MIFSQGGGGSDNLLNAITAELENEILRQKPQDGRLNRRVRKALAFPQKIGKVHNDETSPTPNNVTNLVPSKKAAFTLAEVLITLGIIGVVAAMTLPTLITKYQKKQTLNQLKKAYSEINQAIRMAEKDFGPLESWDFANFETAEERIKYFSENYFFPNIKIIKKCVPASEECWSSNPLNIDGATFTATGLNSAGSNAIVTASGYSVYYWVHRVGNGGWFFIDTNGIKKPNTLGKDIFVFIMSWGNAREVSSSPTDQECVKKLGFTAKGLDCQISPDRNMLITGGGEDSEYDYNKVYSCTKGSNKSEAGGYCAALIMYDGWEMKEDYPW